MLTLEDVKASLPDEMAAMGYPQIEMQAATIQEETDAEGLRTAMAEMDEQAGMMPPQLKTAFAFMKQQMQKRIDEIESGETTEGSTENGGDE